MNFLKAHIFIESAVIFTIY